MVKASPTMAVLGGSLSGNKGAASMVLAVVDGVRSRIPDAKVLVFSPYPSEDRHQKVDADIVAFAPRDMLGRVLLAALLSLATLRRWKPRAGPSGMLAHADVAADVSGIAFMDGRGLPTLIYNVLLVFLPWAFGVPVVKIAQALGPFDQRPNRIAARQTLLRVRWIGLRGASTARNVESLGLSNTEEAADVAFLMESDVEAENRAIATLPVDRRVTLVAPSAVVLQSCRDDGIDYVATMVRLIDGLSAEGHEIVLIAHSARRDAGSGHTNDLPVCREIAAASSASLLDEEYDARMLRSLIGRSRLLVTSRFHGMISGLATATPTYVIGWSHKYREVLSEFGLESSAVDFRELSDHDLLRAILQLDEDANDIRGAIAAHLPTVRADAERNIDRLSTVLVGET